MRRVLTIAALCLLIALPVRADFDEGLDGYEQGDYEAALKEWQPLAEEGDADAQFGIGFIYMMGHGVPQDLVQAHMWFDLAAARGHGEARQAREDIATLMSPSQIKEAQRLAREWMEAHQ